MKTNVHGNITGIRDSVLEVLEGLYSLELETDSFLPHDLMMQLAKLSCSLNREIAIYITRDGEIVDVSVGTDSSVELQDFRLRRNMNRLSCVRCVHTHPNGDGHLSDVDLSALRSYKYDAMTAIGVINSEPTFVQSAFLISQSEYVMDVPVRWYKVPDSSWLAQIDESENLIDSALHISQDEKPEHEKAVLIGIESNESLEELASLAKTAGAEVISAMLQKREKPDNTMFIGKGKAEELALYCQSVGADLCILDEEVSGMQVRNLEDTLRVKVIDRTTLILDIFAQRASSAEGRLQVELAQLQYQSTRLIGQGMVLSRLAGGIGTRGPGESKLEINRRRIRERINELNKRLNQLEKQREIRRKSREKNEIPVVALVGYTNAGKSTLLNKITGSQVYVQDQLFATLDAVSRKAETANHLPFLLVDTVGFIRKLPHTLVKAFRSTLEEAARADILVIVSDGSSKQIVEQHNTVEEVLTQLDAVSQTRIEAINKCDMISDTGSLCPEALIPGSILISVKTGKGMDQLLCAIEKELQHLTQPVRISVPFDKYGIMSQIRCMGTVTEESYTDTGAQMTILLSADDVNRITAKFGSDIICS